MNRVFALIATSAALIGLAACADSATKVTGAPDLQPALSVSELNPNYKHVMKLKDQALQDAKDAAKEAAKEAKIRSGSGTGIYYHGGPILYQTNVAAIYWASSAIYTYGPTPGTSDTTGNTGDASLIGDFLRGLGGSAYFKINTTYYDASRVPVQNVVNYTQYWANSGSVPADGATVSDGTMFAMLQAGFNSGKLHYDPNTLYAIFTAGKVNLGGGFGSQYCAYHGDGTVSITGLGTRRVLYAAMPYDYAYPSGCTSGYASPNADRGANYEVSVLAHEIEETTTDGFGTAWWDSRGYENADKCAWTWGTRYTANGGQANMNINGKDYLVQQNWVNAGSGGCALHL